MLYLASFFFLSSFISLFSQVSHEKSLNRVQDWLLYEKVIKLSSGMLVPQKSLTHEMIKTHDGKIIGVRLIKTAFLKEQQHNYHSKITQQAFFIYKPETAVQNDENHLTNILEQEKILFATLEEPHIHPAKIMQLHDQKSYNSTNLFLIVTGCTLVTMFLGGNLFSTLNSYINRKHT